MITIADVIRVVGSEKVDFRHLDPLDFVYEEISARDIAYNDVGLTVCGVVTIFCDSPRYTFAKVLGLWLEPKMMNRLANRQMVSICGNTVLPTTPTPIASCGPDDPDRFLKTGNFCSIGGFGFGYERNENGVPFRIPHLGNVVIGEFVQIGSHVCIDRAVIGSTVIGDNVKIDNLVHVAHNAQIGKNTLIVAGAVVGGSVVIGENCFIGMNASIKQKVKIGNNVTVGAGAVVLRDVPDGATVVGNPARILEK